jgi:RNA polymerase sigma-70 factor (ECF subfamily)
MSDVEHRRRFELLALPHLDAAYNLARWLTHDDHDAQDVVQEAFLRAMRYFSGFRGDNARPWVLQIVRNTCLSWLHENRTAETVALDEDDEAIQGIAAPAALEPCAMAMRSADRAQIDQAIAALPFVYREVFVLRELEDLSYSDIAHVASIPLGTVMSRLSRARALMRQALMPDARPILRTVPRVARDARNKA